MQRGTTLSNPSLSILSPFLILETIIIQLSCSGWLLYSPRACNPRKKWVCCEQIPKVWLITIAPLRGPRALQQIRCSHHARRIPHKHRADTSTWQQDLMKEYDKMPMQVHPSELDASVFVKTKDQQIKTRTEIEILLEQQKKDHIFSFSQYCWSLYQSTGEGRLEVKTWTTLLQTGTMYVLQIH